MCCWDFGFVSLIYLGRWEGWCVLTALGFCTLCCLFGLVGFARRGFGVCRRVETGDCRAGAWTCFVMGYDDDDDNL